MPRPVFTPFSTQYGVLRTYSINYEVAVVGVMRSEHKQALMRLAALTSVRPLKVPSPWGILIALKVIIAHDGKG